MGHGSRSSQTTTAKQTIEFLSQMQAARKGLKLLTKLLKNLKKNKNIAADGSRLPTLSSSGEPSSLCRSPRYTNALSIRLKIS